MNKVATAMFFLLFSFGCSRNTIPPNDFTQNSTGKVSSDLYFEVCNSLDDKLSAVSENESDTIFYNFQKKYLATIERLNAELNLRESTEKSHPSNWVKMLMSEGMPYFAPNWKYLQKRFGKYLSSTYNDWLLHLDETENIINDAYLLVTPDRLRHNIIFLEHLSETNHNFIAIKDIKSRLSWYLNLYLKGSDNSPVFDKYGIRPKFRTSYEKFLSENKNSKYYPTVKIMYEKVATNSKANHKT